jgi:hypothetical protein
MAVVGRPRLSGPKDRAAATTARSLAVRELSLCPIRCHRLGTPEGWFEGLDPPMIVLGAAVTKAGGDGIEWR